MYNRSASHTFDTCHRSLISHDTCPRGAHGKSIGLSAVRTVEGRQPSNHLGTVLMHHQLAATGEEHGIRIGDVAQDTFCRMGT